MARILIKNKYELAAGRLRVLERKTDPNKRLVQIERDKMDRAIETQHKNIVLGGLHRIKYREFQNDPRPLALILSEPRDDIGCVAAINLHYLTPLHAQILLKAIKFRNAPAIKRGKPPVVFYEMIKDIYIPYKAYRLYKYPAIKAMEYIPISQWMDTVNTEISHWQGKFY